MKVLIFILIILIQNRYVNCDLLGYIKGKWTGLTNYLKNLVSHLTISLKDSIQETLVNGKPPFMKTETIKKKTASETINKDVKEAFINFNENEEGTIDRVDYLSLKKEPAVLLATPQLAFWHGRSMESHIVKTEDGYFLTLHRVTAQNYPSPNRTVLLHHGLLGSSTDWILLGPKNSLPYLLADTGYDVWIANARGNYYSRGHMSMTIDFPEFWDFSFQEMGIYDLPAVIDYIRKVRDTNDSINFIGHSMGASALLVLLSSVPRYNEYLRLGILLAPLAFMENVKGPLKLLMTLSDELIKMMGDGEFLPSRKVPSWLANKYCEGPKRFCTNPLLFLSGVSTNNNWSASFIARLLYHIPAGGSTNTMLHYIQMAQNKKFHKFKEPTSEFPLINVTLPIALFSSSDDWLATMPNVLKLYFSLPNPIDHHVIRGRNMSHTDFVWGSETNIIIFNKIIEYLENGLVWNSINSNEV